MAYRIKCEECGGDLAVTAGQAGETVRCNCGATLQVPTLRNLRQLPTLEEQASAAVRTWSRAQGVLFSCGLLTTALAGLLTAYATYQRAQINVAPINIKDVEFLFDMDRLTPTQSWEAWTKEFRDYELLRGTPPHEINRAAARRLLVGSVLGGTFTVIGLATMIAAVAGLVPSQPARR